MINPILEVNNLSISYIVDKSKNVAVDNVSFYLNKGEILGIVGESGSGKSTIAMSVMNLINKNYTTVDDGEIIYRDKNILNMSNKDLRSIRGQNISMIFQSPQSSLDPVYTIGYQIVETLKAHSEISDEDAMKRSIELLNLVKIDRPSKIISQYAHELSGGMQQRIMIAIAIACNPEIIIADEPTTALDVITQKEILNLIKELRDEFNISVIFITHDLAVVSQLCDRVIVMRNGKIVEENITRDLFLNPKTEYTKKLISSVPSVTEDQEWLAIN